MLLIISGKENKCIITHNKNAEEPFRRYAFMAIFHFWVVYRHGDLL